VSQILALISRKVSYFDRSCLGWGYEQFERLKDIIMNILMGTSITAKYENCVEVSMQDMFDLANDNDLKDLTQKCKNEPDKTKRRNVKLTMPVFYPCIDTHVQRP